MKSETENWDCGHKGCVKEEQMFTGIMRNRSFTGISSQTLWTLSELLSCS